MDKEELLKEKRHLINLKAVLRESVNNLSSTTLDENLKKINYILSKDYLVDDKNNKVDNLSSILNLRESRISACNNLITNINYRLNEIEKKLVELNELI